LAVLLGPVAGGYAQGNQAPFSIRISTPNAVVEAWAKVRVSVLLTNTSTRIIGLYKGPNTDALLNGYQVHVHDAANRHFKMSKLAWKLSGMKPAVDDTNDYSDYRNDSVMALDGGYLPIKPGRTDETWLDVSEACTLVPGTYTIWLSRVDLDTKVTVKSNTITLTITGPTK